MKKDIIPSNSSEILSTLHEINPFWDNQDWPELPQIRRYPFYSVVNYLEEIGSQRALFLKGFRGVGKSTLLRQIGYWLRDERKVEAKNIVYVDFEKRSLRRIPWKAWFNVWEKELKPAEGHIYFLLDEIQYADDWAQEVRSMLVDAQYRIVATGSAAAEIQTVLDQEVRRWISLSVPALLFYEYLLIFHSNTYAHLENEILKGRSFFQEGMLDTAVVKRIFDSLKELFKSYLLHGGFPEIAEANLNLTDAQRLLADVIDKALYQDMRTQFKGEDIEHLEKIFEYICRNPGVLLDKSMVSGPLEVSRPTTARYVKALEDGDFICSLNNQNRAGKKTLKAKPKVYPADASLRNSFLERTEEVLLQSEEMGHIVEGAVATHLSAYARAEGGQIGYWRKNDNEEIDFIYKGTNNKYWIIESKYGQSNAKWLRALEKWPVSEKQRVSVCFLVNRDNVDAKERALSNELKCPLHVIPAPVFLYLLSRELWISANKKMADRDPTRNSTTGADTVKAEIEDIKINKKST